MSSKKSHGLGKGMGSLLDNFDYDLPIAEEPATVNAGTPKEMEKAAPIAIPVASDVKMAKAKEEKPEDKNALSSRIVSIDNVKPNVDQPRKHFDEDALGELALSIKSQGVLQPLLVEEYAPGLYSIIAGERRYRAAKLAGLKEIPVLVKNFTVMQRLEVALIENIQREDLNSIEEASAYQFLIQKSGLSQEQLADKVGKKRSTIANALRLLQLPDSMQDDVVSGALSAGHARAILSLVNPSDRMILRNRIIDNELSVREAETAAEELNKGQKLVLKRKKLKQKDPDIQAAEDKFLHVFGTRIELRGSLKHGKIEIPYTSSYELERIYKLLSTDPLFEE